MTWICLVSGSQFENHYHLVFCSSLEMLTLKNNWQAIRDWLPSLQNKTDICTLSFYLILV